MADPIPIPLPRLELGEADPDFDEAVILVNGHEEETITISCEGSRELAERLVNLVNHHAAVVAALRAATHALRSYQFGNGAPGLAEKIADHCENVSKQMGAAA